MALNLFTLLPAKINTSEIATKYDVSSSIAAYNPATAINANTTTIDGGKITTGTVLSNAFFGNVIYNLVAGVPATESNYTMKIDLANGRIHIR
jgi:hypothetical protein